MSVGSALGRQRVALFAKVVASGVRLSSALRLLNSYECDDSKFIHTILAGRF
ncbi:hypothetical protein [Aulosira sp. FACHB-615]|uniref:hypothetical protein n=1 Tax=Nostocales TaxID=1161 RepID=UPI0016891FF2|nr:hypothetical protein [Aulosira sp. FACHB-615]MBD2486285.1 hypothetical protein [Aulosira sp. FACHB-615]